MNYAVSIPAAPSHKAMWAVALLVLSGGVAVLWLGPAALAVAPGLIAVALLWRARPVWLLAAALVYVPFSYFLEEFALGSDVGGAFNTVGMIKDLMHIAVFGLIAGRAALRRESIIHNDPVNWLFFAYFGWILIHIVNPTALWPGFWSWRIYVEFGIFFLLVRAAAQNLRDVRLLMVVWALLALPVMVFAVAKVATGGILAFYGQADTWEGARLSFGGETNANHLALFLMPVVLGTVGLAWSSARRRTKLAWLTLAAAAFLQTGLTLSRRSWVAMAVGLAVLAWFDRRRKLWFGLGFLAALAMIPFLPAGIFDRLASIVDITDYRNVGRFAEWREVLSLVFAGPVQALWGIGPGRVGQVALDFKAAGALSSHNSYLLQLADLGAVGALFLVILVGWHITLAWKLARKHRGAVVGKLAATLLAIQLAYALTAMFGITYHNYPTNLLAFTAMALVQTLRLHAQAERRPAMISAAQVTARVLPHWRKLLLAGFGTAIVAYGVAWLLPQQWRASGSMMVYADPPPEINAFGANDPFAAALADHPGPPGGKETLRVLFALQSKRAIHAAFAELNLLPALFPERWDAQAEQWRKTPPTPSMVYERAWRKHVYVDFFRRTGRLRVTAQWSDPQTAAALAAAVMRHGDRLASAGLREYSAAKKKALDAEMSSLSNRLQTSENELAMFRQKNELVDTEYQARVAIGLRGDVWTRRLEKQIERAVLATYAGPSHPRMRLLAAQIAALNQASKHLDGGAAPYLPALDRLPEIRTADRRLARSQNLLDATFTHLAPLHAKWRLRTELNEPAAIIYEPPVVPERRHFPARTLVAFAAAALAGYLYLLAVLLAPLRRLRMP